MLKRGRTLLAININIIMVIMVLALMYGCPKSPTEPSYSGPNPAPGFEISFKYGELYPSVLGGVFYINAIVDYKGAEGGGVNYIYTRVGDGRCKNYYKAHNSYGENRGPSGTYSGPPCDIYKNGTYLLEVYLEDNNKRDSNLLSTTITVTGLAQ